MLNNLSKMPKKKSNNPFVNSSLMINPTNPRHLQKIPSLDAHIIVINLEDGIADAKKAEALHSAMEALSTLESAKGAVTVRTNEMDSPYFKAELDAINIVRPDAIRIPKLKDVSELLKLEELLHPDIDIHLTIETKEAFSQIGRLKTSDRVTTLFFGAIDLLEDLGLGSSLIDKESGTLKYMMSKFIVESRTHGFTPVSFVWQRYEDTDGFMRWLEVEKELGFEAKACITPAQVAAANSFFGPSAPQIEEALYIKEIFEKNEALGIGGFKDERYGFIDAPIYKNAVLTLKKAHIL